MADEKEFLIGSRAVGENHPAYIIAEGGVNHRCDMKIALEMIRQAKQAGADAIKFQTYKAETLVTKWAPRYWEDPEPSGTQYKIFEKCDHFGPDEYRKLAQCCKKQEIAFLSTPFDLEAVDLLDKLEMPAYKVASADITDYPLLERIAETGKPVLQSLGASTLDEAEGWLKFARGCGIGNICLMHCVLSYPTALDDANLRRIALMGRRFTEVLVGYSDHTDATVCSEVAVAAVTLGARIIEKHFTLDRSWPGDDHYHSADPHILGEMVQAVRRTERAIGIEYDGILACEKNSREFARRSIIAAREIRKGELIIEDMLIMKRPGTGICPTEISKVVGKKAARDINEDAAICWEDLEQQ